MFLQSDPETFHLTVFESTYVRTIDVLNPLFGVSINSGQHQTHRLIHSKFSSAGTRALQPTLMRKNGCQPQATMASQSHRAYNPRSASTITSHSGGTAFPNSLSSPSQYGRHDPSWCAGSTFQATGIAQPLRTTLTAKMVHRLPSDVASSTSGN